MIRCLKAGWQAEYELWRSRSLADPEPVFLWVDGVYAKAGLENDKAAILVHRAIADVEPESGVIGAGEIDDALRLRARDIRLAQCSES